MEKLNHLLSQLDNLFNDWQKFIKTNITTEQQKEAFKHISSNILSWDFYIWWKIPKRGLFSNFFWNIINDFTQSYYSHVNFCFPYKKDWKLKWYYVIWAENEKWVIFDFYDLEKNNDFIFVVKQFDKDDFLKYFNIKKYSLNITYLFWENKAKSYTNRYKTFYNFFDKEQYHLNGIGLNDLIEFELFYEKIKNTQSILNNEKKDLSYLYKNIKDKFYDFKEKVWYNLENIEVKYIKSKSFLDKLFFNWGILKFLVHSIGLKYDMMWALSIVLVDRKKDIDYTKKWPKELFCSELISASMLFAGFYPFDLVTKAPDMVSPWDMIDPSYWIYKENYDVVNFKTKEILKVNNLQSLKKFKQMIKNLK